MTELYKINVDSDCECQYFGTCEHQFRQWSLLWFQGIRKRMPLALDHPPLLFRCKA